MPMTKIVSFWSERGPGGLEDELLSDPPLSLFPEHPTIKNITPKNRKYLLIRYNFSNMIPLNGVFLCVWTATILLLHIDFKYKLKELRPLIILNVY